MKSIYSIDKAVGGDGLKVKGTVGISGDMLVVQAEGGFPLAKVVDPLMTVVDNMVDKIEKLIPGDQTALASRLKAEARQEIVELLSEKPVVEAPAPAALPAADEPAPKVPEAE